MRLIFDFRSSMETGARVGAEALLRVQGILNQVFPL